MQQCIKILLFHIWSLTCFARHTAHHQEPKTALAASGFPYVEGCLTCSWRTLWGTVCLTTSTNNTYKQPSTYEKPEAASAVLGSLWWAVCSPKHVELHIWNNKILIHCSIILDFLYKLFSETSALTYITALCCNGEDSVCTVDFGHFTDLELQSWSFYVAFISVHAFTYCVWDLVQSAKFLIYFGKCCNNECN